jgi:hypothetical protein
VSANVAPYLANRDTSRHLTSLTSGCRVAAVERETPGGPW